MGKGCSQNVLWVPERPWGLFHQKIPKLWHIQAIPNILPKPRSPTFPFYPKGRDWMHFPQSCGSHLSQQENQHFLQDMEFPWHRPGIPARTCKSMVSPFPKQLQFYFFNINLYKFPLGTSFLPQRNNWNMWNFEEIKPSILKYSTQQKNPKNTPMRILQISKI